MAGCFPFFWQEKPSADHKKPKLHACWLQDKAKQEAL